jgi:aspartyl-tRNA(Asn)/glutamyl-tRNA(Gln) amidotransferase subunit C
MPNTVSLDEVRHVARLARLGLTDEQVGVVAHDLNTILAHMDVLSKVDTQGVPEYTAADTVMPLRVDHGAAIPLDAPVESFAPEMRDGFFVVPRLATHEDAEP